MPTEYKNLKYTNSFFSKTAMETEISRLSAQGWKLKSNNLIRNIFNVAMERHTSDEEFNKNLKEYRKLKKNIIIILIILILLLTFIFLIQ